MPRTIHKETYRKLIDRLTALRVESGVTQQVLAERLGRPQSFVSKVEGYERRLDVVEFLEIMLALGADPRPLINLVWKDIQRSD